MAHYKQQHCNSNPNKRELERILIALGFLAKRNGDNVAGVLPS